VAQVAQHPDADLLRHCAAYHAAYAEGIRLNDPQGGSDAEWDAQIAAWDAAIEGVLSCVAITPEGLRAKAGVVRIEVHDASVTYLGSTIGDAQRHEQMAHSLACDILGRTQA
jgi:hypothetical protein